MIFGPSTPTSEEVCPHHCPILQISTRSSIKVFTKLKEGWHTFGGDRGELTIC